MRTRQDIEALEDQILAPYAMRSKDSEGRDFKEPQHEVRTCYQRDRDRIVHSEAFRKLEYKTQVFVIFEGDYYRTRLTHTIEVAQIARTIGRNLRLNEDLIEAIALAHDLGHPPFGHAGEDALNEIMRSGHKSWSFNHNIHSFQIVSKHEKRYPDFDGLNLTKEVLIGILKHSTIYDQAGVVDKFKNIGTTLEAKVVDIADSLAYLAHDIDDGLTSGCINENDLMESEFWQKALKMARASIKDPDPQMQRYHIVRSLIDMQMKDLLYHSSERLKKNDFKDSDEVKMFHLKNPDQTTIGFGQEIKKQRDSLQSMLHDKLYKHYRVERMTSKARRIIQDLFGVYIKNPAQLPYSIYQRGKKTEKAEKYEIICHYIASMTDRFALDEHKKFFDPYQKV